MSVLKALEKVNEDVLSYLIHLPSETRTVNDLNNRISSSSINSNKGVDERTKKSHQTSSSTHTSRSTISSSGSYIRSINNTNYTQSSERSGEHSFGAYQSNSALNSIKPTSEIKSWLYLIRKLIIESREQFK